MLPDNRSHALVLFLAVVSAFVLGVLVTGRRSNTEKPSPPEVLAERQLPPLNRELLAPGNELLEAPKILMLPAAPQPPQLLFPLEVERAMMFDGLEGLQNDPSRSELHIELPRE